MALAVAACGGSKPTPTPVPTGPLNLTGTSWLRVSTIILDTVSVPRLTSSAGVVVDLSCATHRWCMAVDSNGDAYTGTR